MSADSTTTTTRSEQVRRPRLTFHAFGATLSAVALAGTALVAMVLSGAPAQAAQTGVTQVSSDPFAGAGTPAATHDTEVEPDTFGRAPTHPPPPAQPGTFQTFGTRPTGRIGINLTFTRQ